MGEQGSLTIFLLKSIPDFLEYLWYQTFCAMAIILLSFPRIVMLIFNNVFCFVSHSSIIIERKASGILRRKGMILFWHRISCNPLYNFASLTNYMLTFWGGSLIIKQTNGSYLKMQANTGTPLRQTSVKYLLQQFFFLTKHT